MGCIELKLRVILEIIRFGYRFEGGSLSRFIHSDENSDFWVDIKCLVSFNALILVYCDLVSLIILKIVSCLKCREFRRPVRQS